MVSTTSGPAAAVRWEAWRPPPGDALLAAVLSGLTVANLGVLGGGRGAAPAALLVQLSLLSVVPIAWRQRAPVITTSLVVAALSGSSVLGSSDYPNGGIGLLVALFSAAVLRPRRVAAALYVASLTPVVITYLLVDSPVAWPQCALAACVLAGAWALGDSTRRWGLRVERVGAEAERAVSEERLRIARELHDVVAHHLSVIALHAGVATYVADTDVPAAKGALAVVGETSRDALVDLRRLLDVLRPGRPDPPLPGQPGLAEVGELVTRMRALGPAVRLTVHGAVRRLPPGAELCVYRVIQESLTNVLKHAGTPVTADVVVDFGEDVVTVTISDDGDGGPAAARPGAHGLRGMRERAELHGGALSAGPAAGGGFEVRLRLPLGEPR